MSSRRRTNYSSPDSRDSSPDSPASVSEHEKGITFSLNRGRTKDSRSLVFGRVDKDDLQDLRSSFRPSFQSKSFDLRCPKLDRQMKRHLKHLHSTEA